MDDREYLNTLIVIIRNLTLYLDCIFFFYNHINLNVDSAKDTSYSS